MQKSTANILKLSAPLLTKENEKQTHRTFSSIESNEKWKQNCQKANQTKIIYQISFNSTVYLYFYLSFRICSLNREMFNERVELICLEISFLLKGYQNP